MVLDLQEGIDMEEVEAVTFNCEVRVFAEDGIATVILPEELRITERLVAHLDAALKQRDLVLKKWTISCPAQEEELKNLSNVLIDPDSE